MTNIGRMLEEAEGDQISYVIIGVATMLMIMMIIISFLRRINLIVYSGITILIVSTSCSLSFKSIYGYSVSAAVPTDLIFKVLAPPIVLASGFNLREKYFFKNIGFINLYGFLGTILSFVIMCVSIYFANKLVEGYIGADPKSYNWSILNVMQMCAPLIITDTWFAQHLLEEGEHYPTLYSIISGEGVLNDAAGLILVDTIIKLSKINGGTQGIGMLGEFTIAFGRASFGSIFCGLLFGGLSCILFKYLKPLKMISVIEVYILLMMAMITHTVADLEIIGLSGVVVLFIFGIVQSHYNRPNLTEESSKTAGFVFELMSWICESCTFLYMGLSFDKPKLVSTPTLIFASVDLVILFVSRIGSIMILSAIANKFSKHNSVTFKETIVIAFGGLARGALPYALAVHISQGQGQALFIENMIPICQVMIVMTLTLLVPLKHLVFKTLVKESKEEGDQLEKIEDENRLDLSGEVEGTKRRTLTLMDMNQAVLVEKKDEGCSLMIQKVDQKVLKPFFIRDYNAGKEHAEDDDSMLQENFSMNFEQDDGLTARGPEESHRLSSIMEEDEWNLTEMVSMTHFARESEIEVTRFSGF